MKDPQQPVTTPPAVEPGRTPEPKEPEPKEPKGKEPPKPEDVLSVKLDGEKVPEKFRGKTLEEVLQLQAELEKRLTQAETENAQWRGFYAAKEQDKPKAQQYDPLEHIDEDQAKAMLTLTDARIQPLVEGMSGVMKQITKASYPDFDQYEKRISEIYHSLPLQHRFHPDYGWDFAYRFAKAEAMGTAKPPPPEPGHSGPEGPRRKEPTLTEEQEHWRKRMGMSVEDYLKYLETKEIGEGGKYRT